MPKRLSTILAPQDLGAVGTEVIGITAKDVISRIDIFFKVTNATVSVMLDAVTAGLSKIELVDGSEVLVSISGAELQAINYYDSKVMPHHELNLTVGGFFEIGLSLDFGRFLWDTEFAFIPTNFSNPQLRITWDEDAVNTSAVVNELAVYAYSFGDEGPSPAAMLINRQIKEYAEAASSTEYSKLPVDRVIRKIILRGFSEDHDPIAQFDTIKLSNDNDAHVQLEITAADFDRILAKVYPRIHEFYTLDAVVTAKTIYSALSKDQQISISYDETPFVTAQSLFALPAWTGAKCALAASVDIKADTAEVSGRMPANCFPLDFGLPNEPDTWLKAEDFGSLLLTLKSSSAADSGDTTSIVVQQVRPY